jgi:hypothetical protein
MAKESREKAKKKGPVPIVVSRKELQRVAGVLQALSGTTDFFSSQVVFVDHEVTVIPESSVPGQPAWRLEPPTVPAKRGRKSTATTDGIPGETIKYTNDTKATVQLDFYDDPKGKDCTHARLELNDCTLTIAPGLWATVTLTDKEAGKGHRKLYIRRPWPQPAIVALSPGGPDMGIDDPKP